ncbi:procollagen-proline 4-dioxygenase [Aureococcus anophagefferens]|nr:procollagen-proline 4-dioxygenase [Aureococcus anophagefferens]
MRPEAQPPCRTSTCSGRRRSSPRGFLTEAECAAVISTTPAIANLGRAHVGGGAGKTSFSDARETLSTNLYVDWARTTPATRVAAKTVELASELLGETIPYEAQEPINFLFYRAGYEYKPHSDGAGGKRGKRVATTLRGDLLFFSYAGGARDARRVPVAAGNKSTLTMWHRAGVSPDEPWDRFGAGPLRPPHLHSRYRGKPAGATDAADRDGASRCFGAAASPCLRPHSESAGRLPYGPASNSGA